MRQTGTAFHFSYTSCAHHFSKIVRKPLTLSVFFIIIFRLSGCGEAWYRAWFGSKRPRVRIPTLRPNKENAEIFRGFRRFFLRQYRKPACQNQQQVQYSGRSDVDHAACKHHQPGFMILRLYLPIRCTYREKAKRPQKTVFSIRSEIHGTAPHRNLRFPCRLVYANHVLIKKPLSAACNLSCIFYYNIHSLQTQHNFSISELKNDILPFFL